MVGCIPEVLMLLLTPILTYLCMSYAKCHVCHMFEICHIRHIRHVWCSDIYNMLYLILSYLINISILVPDISGHGMHFNKKLTGSGKSTHP